MRSAGAVKTLTAVALLALVVVAVAGCPGLSATPVAPVGAVMQLKPITVAGLAQSYFLYAPPSVNPEQAAPLVVVLHGQGDTGQDAENYMHFGAVADCEGFLLVYPNAEQLTWRSDIVGLPTAIDDAAFIRAVIKRVQADHLVDPRRIYLTGHSNGGFMTYRAAFELSDVLAAAGVSCATLTPALISVCPPDFHMPICMILGTVDPFVPWNGRTVDAFGTTYRMYSGPDTAVFFVDRNMCGTPSTHTLLPDVDPTDNTRVFRFDYPSCSGGDVTLFEVVNGEHTWAGEQRSYTRSGTTRDIDGAETMWAFFKTHTRPES